MASYSVRPGDLRLLLGSPPSRCLTTSVVRLSMPTLLTPATYRPSHFTRNLKFLYGSNRCALTLNWAMGPSSSRRDLSGHLLDADDHELGRLERCESHEDVHDAEIDVGLRGGLAIALHEVRLARGLSLERALAEEVLHEGAHVEPDLRPQRLVVGLEHHPLRPAEEALLEEEREAADGHVLPLGRERVRAVERPSAPHHGPVD